MSEARNSAQEWIERRRVVEVVKTWERTPYLHMGRVKGAGVDCLTLLAETFYEANLVPFIDVEYYPPDWMQHREAERYLEGLLQYTKEIPGNPQPGDIALWKCGRCFSHGAIVINWPIIIHAQLRCMVMQEDAEAAAWLKRGHKNELRECKFFSFWAK